MSWSWSAAQGSSLPPGLACCRESFGGGIPFGRGVVVNGAIAGVPTAPGNYEVVISVTDNGAPAQQVSAAYTIAIAPPPPPSVNLTPAPAIGTLNSPYVGFSFTATNGLPPLSCSESGPLPPGMLFDATGMLSGTPTADGTFPISVKAVQADDIVCRGFETANGVGEVPDATGIIDRRWSGIDHVGGVDGVGVADGGAAEVVLVSQECSCPSTASADGDKR